MKNKSIYLNKISVHTLNQLLLSRGDDTKNHFVAYPDRQQDYDVLLKINTGSTFKATITNTRILWKHKNFFRKLKACANNEALQRMINKDEIHPTIVDNLREKLKSDIEVLRYILKWRYLPLDEEIHPDGQIIYKVSSQAFDELDELVFDEFANNCYNYLSDLFNVSRFNFNKW